MSKYFRYIFYLVFVTLSIVEVSCKKKTPENIGLPLLPDSDLLNATFTDTATLITHTIKDDSLNTKNVTPILLGNINDPIFGSTQSSIFTQFSLSQTNPSFGTNPVLDSAVLSLAYNSGQYYGTLYPQKFDVYEVSEMMSKDATYYSNTLLQYYTTQQIGSATITPDVTDSVQVGTVKFPAHIRIKLSDVLFQNFLTNSTYTSSYNSNSSFQTAFKGIYIKSSSDTSQAILYMNITDAYSRLTLYYKNAADTLSHSYYFDISKDNCARYSYFEHNYTSAITNQLNTSATIQRDTVFVQPMAGVRTKITMPYLGDFFKNGKVAINKAELILPVEPSSVSAAFSAHPKLVATIADSVLGPVIMPDYFEGATYFGGDYDATNNVYKFNIARYVQRVLNGTTKNQGLYIITNARPTTANRVQLIGGSKALTNRMRLKITYTPLQ